MSRDISSDDQRWPAAVEPSSAMSRLANVLPTLGELGGRLRQCSAGGCQRWAQGDGAVEQRIPWSTSCQVPPT